MTNVIIKGAVNLRKVFLLMAKIVGSKKPSFLIVILLAAIQSFAITVKEKIFQMKFMTSRILHHLESGLLLRRVICRYGTKQTAFNSS